MMEVVQIVEFEAVKVGEGAALCFRIEILRDAKRRFWAKVWRTESHRLQPTFPQQKGQPVAQRSDVEILFREDHALPARHFDSKEAALNATKRALEKQLGFRRR